ncbi:general stress protein [Micrococcus terreus]|nr:general stress protein [Micrococcus terreus]
MPAQSPSSRLIPNTTDVDYRVLQSVDTYAKAQALVDRLSDGGFPVEKVRIVGTGLRSVEQVVGRLTTGKAALQGALQGLWFGLMVGILLGIFAAPGSWLWTVLVGVGIGAVWGAIFGAISHAMTGGKRDFASLSTFEAEAYDVLVEATHVSQAAEIARAPKGPAAQG